jgi:hypothetical protein
LDFSDLRLVVRYLCVEVFFRHSRVQLLFDFVKAVLYHVAKRARQAAKQ